MTESRNDPSETPEPVELKYPDSAETAPEVRINVSSGSSTYRYRDAGLRRAYMRQYMAARRRALR